MKQVWEKVPKHLPILRQNFYFYFLVLKLVHIFGRFLVYTSGIVLLDSKRTNKQTNKQTEKLMSCSMKNGLPLRDLSVVVLYPKFLFCSNSKKRQQQKTATATTAHTHSYNSFFLNISHLQLPSTVYYCNTPFFVFHMCLMFKTTFL